jgi:UDP-N-acetylmuramyl tripeptide synthase
LPFERFSDANPDLSDQNEWEDKSDLNIRNSYYPPSLFRSYNLEELLEIGNIDPDKIGLNLTHMNFPIITGLNTDQKLINKDYFSFNTYTNPTKSHKSFGTKTNDKKHLVFSNAPTSKTDTCYKKTMVIEANNFRDIHSRIATAYYGKASSRMTILGVLGTNGKTSSSWYIRGILESMGRLTGIIGSIEYALCNDPINPNGRFWMPSKSDFTAERNRSTPFHFTQYPNRKYTIHRSTPKLLDLHQILTKFADSGATSSIIECSSNSVKKDCLNQLKFDILLLTNVKMSQTLSKTTAKHYIEDKIKLFLTLNDNFRQRAILNLDDPFVEQFAWAAEKVPVITYSISDTDSDVFIENVKSSIVETSLILSTPLNNLLKLTIKQIGNYNTYNTLAAVATGIAVGSPFNVIVTGIEAVEVIPGRCELIEEGQKFAVLVDLAKTPEAISRLLDEIRECKPSRIITVVGCHGNQKKNIRSCIGEVVHHKSDIVILTNDNPILELPDEIIRDIIAGWPDKILLKNSWFLYPWYQDIARLPNWFNDQALWAQAEIKRYIIEDRYLAIRCAIFSAMQNDVVVIFGKGERDYYDIIGSNVLCTNDDIVRQDLSICKRVVKGWFDDRAECRDALTKIPQLDVLLPQLDRSFLPWSWPQIHRKHPLE